MSAASDPYKIEGLPIRTAFCKTCNYADVKRPDYCGASLCAAFQETRIRDIARSAINPRQMHQCHNANGSVCFGSYVASLPSQKDRLAALEKYIFIVL